MQQNPIAKYVDLQHMIDSLSKGGFGKGERQVRIYSWGELPACLLRWTRKLEAYATV